MIIDLIIRPAVLTDARAILQVNYDAAHALAAKYYAASILDAWAPLTDERLKRFEGFILANVDDETFLVAQLDSDIVGFGRLVFDTGEITSLYVSPLAAGGGIGSKLMKALEECARGRCLSNIWLTAALNAKEFYCRCGFIDEEEMDYELKANLSMRVVKMRKLLLK